MKRLSFTRIMTTSALAIGFLSGLTANGAGKALALRGAWPNVAGDMTEEVRVVGDYAYLANGFAGLQIIDVSDPSQPMSVGQLPLRSGAFCTATDGYAVSGVYGGQLQLADVSDPTNPIGLSSYNGEAPAEALSSRRPHAAAGLIYWPNGIDDRNTYIPARKHADSGGTCALACSCAFRHHSFCC